MSGMLLNRDGFVMPADGWYQLAPVGEFPHAGAGVVQVVDEEACEAMVHRFREDAKAANFAGLLVDFDHFSLDGEKHTEAAGWVVGLEYRGPTKLETGNSALGGEGLAKAQRPQSEAAEATLGNAGAGLWGKIRWSDVGEAAVKGGRYRHLSPVWSRGDCADLGNGRVRPVRLLNAAVTNDPNMKGMVPLSNREGEDSTAKGAKEEGESGPQMDADERRLENAESPKGEPECLEWVLGPEEEGGAPSCPSCAALAGQVHTKAEWEAAGVAPGSDRLYCQGHCRCKLAASGKPSSGAVVLGPLRKEPAVKNAWSDEARAASLVVRRAKAAERAAELAAARAAVEKAKAATLKARQTQEFTEYHGHAPSGLWDRLNMDRWGNVGAKEQPGFWEWLDKGSMAGDPATPDGMPDKETDYFGKPWNAEVLAAQKAMYAAMDAETELVRKEAQAEHWEQARKKLVETFRKYRGRDPETETEWQAGAYWAGMGPGGKRYAGEPPTKKPKAKPYRDPEVWQDKKWAEALLSGMDFGGNEKYPDDAGAAFGRAARAKVRDRVGAAELARRAKESPHGTRDPRHAGVELDDRVVIKAPNGPTGARLEKLSSDEWSRRDKRSREAFGISYNDLVVKRDALEEHKELEALGPMGQEFLDTARIIEGGVPESMVPTVEKTRGERIMEAVNGVVGGVFRKSSEHPEDDLAGQAWEADKARRRAESLEADRLWREANPGLVGFQPGPLRNIGWRDEARAASLLVRQASSKEERRKKEAAAFKAKYGREPKDDAEWAEAAVMARDAKLKAALAAVGNRWSDAARAASALVRRARAAMRKAAKKAADDAELRMAIDPGVTRGSGDGDPAFQRQEQEAMDSLDRERATDEERKEESYARAKRKAANDEDTRLALEGADRTQRGSGDGDPAFQRQEQESMAEGARERAAYEKRATEGGKRGGHGDSTDAFQRQERDMMERLRKVQEARAKKRGQVENRWSDAARAASLAVRQAKAKARHAASGGAEETETPEARAMAAYREKYGEDPSTDEEIAEAEELAGLAESERTYGAPVSDTMAIIRMRDAGVAAFRAKHGAEPATDADWEEVEELGGVPTELREYGSYGPDVEDDGLHVDETGVLRRRPKEDPVDDGGADAAGVDLGEEGDAADDEGKAAEALDRFEEEGINALTVAEGERLMAWILAKQDRGEELTPAEEGFLEMDAALLAGEGDVVANAWSDESRAAALAVRRAKAGMRAKAQSITPGGGQSGGSVPWFDQATGQFVMVVPPWFMPPGAQPGWQPGVPPGMQAPAPVGPVYGTPGGVAVPGAPGPWMPGPGKAARPARPGVPRK